MNKWVRSALWGTKKKASPRRLAFGVVGSARFYKTQKYALLSNTSFSLAPHKLFAFDLAQGGFTHKS